MGTEIQQTFCSLLYYNYFLFMSQLLFFFPAIKILPLYLVFHHIYCVILILFIECGRCELDLVVLSLSCKMTIKAFLFSFYSESVGASFPTPPLEHSVEKSIVPSARVPRA